MTHDFLVSAAYKWVKKPYGGGCGVAFKELKTACEEIPDVIGFRSWGGSVMIECKTSRADFLADRKKKFRTETGGAGSYRYYLCPTGLISKDEIPDGWGLCYVGLGGKVQRVVRATQRSFDQKDSHAEHVMLYSALRRLELRGLVKEIYKPAVDLPVFEQVRLFDDEKQNNGSKDDTKV